jgi:polyisoprenoid-binding protein YceI
LKGADFFDVENYPRVTFVAKNVDIKSGSVTGELTIKGITKEVTMTSEYNGVSVDPWGNTKHGLEVTGKVNRSDFGLTWNAPLETGGVLVSDEVTFNIDLQLLESVEAPVSEMAQ